MNELQALILGIVQGLTEFIPVSSSGHLVVLHDWLGVTNESLVFDVALHLGTLLALLIYFRKDLIKLVKSLFTKGSYSNLAVVLIVATIPAVIFGVLLQDLAETTFRSSFLVAFNMAAVAILMLVAEKYVENRPNSTKLKQMSKKQGLLVGLAQSVALIPGVSRSGVTITAGFFAGIDRSDATRFSFLLGIPIMIGAILKVFSDSSNFSQLGSEKSIFIIGILSAFVSGLFAIKFMIKFLSKHKLNIFAYYRIIFAVIIVIVALN